MVLLLLVLLGAIGLLSFYLHPEFFVDKLQQFRVWRMGLQQESVVLNGQKIHYLVGGAGKPLVLVHGLGGRSEDWIALIPQLMNHGYRVYAPDLLGFGQSARPDVDYSISLEENIVRLLLDSQNLKQPDMAGWSMGGWIALKFAADRPERVHKLILLDSAGVSFDARNVPLLRPKTEADLARMMNVLTPHPPSIPSFYAADLLRGFAREDWIIDRALKSMYTGKDLMDGRLGTVKAPVLLIWGRQDVLTPPSMGEQMRSGIPHSELKAFDGCGHLAPVECSGEVGQAMVEFLKSGDASGQRSTFHQEMLTKSNWAGTCTKVTSRS
ncbi:MAG TPA: alpha/beta hydrolase [Candidatus Acidoferrales bacterium]|nr:alpha/beta hydrolase [Candidatus Acidoferrales bacterium]